MKTDQELSRREALRWLGTAIAVAPVVGCNTGTTSSDDAGTTTGTDAAASAADDAATSTAADAAASTTDAATVTESGWATGGTAAMTDLATYPDPFSAVTDTSCTPTCEMTLGPCHDDEAPEREDISEAQDGLPMRFQLRILDANCEPVTDANVDIWHCNPVGLYSSATVDNVAFCTANDAAALAAQWFRGYAEVDSNGVASFNSCFPGWYSSRAVHIHLTIRRPNRSGTEYLTSQVCFPEELTNDIFTNHPVYSGHGLPDTSNSTDTVFPADSYEDYQVEWQKMTDGAILCYKTIIIRSSTSDDVCSVSGSSGGGGGGGGGPPGS